MDYNVDTDSARSAAKGYDGQERMTGNGTEQTGAGIEHRFCRGEHTVRTDKGRVGTDCPGRVPPYPLVPRMGQGIYVFRL